jgi:hypothetical protein
MSQLPGHGSLIGCILQSLILVFGLLASQSRHGDQRRQTIIAGLKDEDQSI